MRSLLFLSSLLLVLLAGCAVESPDWTRGQPSSYPSSDYLTAVGVSRVLNLAEQKARQELQLKCRWPHEVAGDIIDRVWIAEVWHDRELDAHYALAVIERQSAGQPLYDALVALERTIVGQVAAAEAAESSLLRWGHYLQAASLAAKRGELVDDLRHVYPAAEFPAVSYSLQQLAERRDQTAAVVGMQVRLRNDRDDAVKQGLIRAFAERGIRLAPDFAADLRISGSVAIVTQPAGAPAIVARIEVEGAGANGSKLPAIDERADSRIIGERLAFRIIAAVSSLAQQKLL